MLDSRLLLDANLPNICITKANPIYWKDKMTDEDKYYRSVDEYKNFFDDIVKKHSLHSQMFTIHDTQKRIPLKKYLVKIILDNPGVSVDDILLYEQARKRLTASLEKSGIGIEKLETRKCRKCICQKNYLNQIETAKLKELFL